MNSTGYSATCCPIEGMRLTEQWSVQSSLERFAAAVAEKMAQISPGHPEDQLRAPFENFVNEVAEALGWQVVLTGEAPLPNRIGRPDYAAHKDDLLAGYIELKAPGTGASSRRFRRRDRQQFRRFSAIPNLLYTDGVEWALYRSGEREGAIARFDSESGATDSDAAARGAEAVLALLRDFLLWQPIAPLDAKGRFDLRAFAKLLAPLCRLLRDQVVDALAHETSPLHGLAGDWRKFLMPDASDAEFADAYAQTATFALLLGRSEGADPLTPDAARAQLAHEHGLLSQALQVLTDPKQSSDVEAALALLQRVIGVAPVGAFTTSIDPWLYFYEDFLAIYDPKLRKNAGVYYTPVPVVRAQVRLIEELLVNQLGKALGFADGDVVTLDPAVGTGTYLLGVIDRTMTRVEANYGAGVLASLADDLLSRMYGFELMVGAYAVAELRINRVLRDWGTTDNLGSARVFLADALESPHAVPPQRSAFLSEISEHRAQAIKVKSDLPVWVCIGNPPYDRHTAATNANQAQTGGWVRYGDEGEGTPPILRDFIEPARQAGQGRRLKNLYNLYVYFWRWALWKAFEQRPAGPGVVSFITASSYLDGDAFCGMREHMRRLCDDIWILDLGGEARGSRKTDNLFAIQTPVAIAIAFRAGPVQLDQCANVHYARINGSRQEKLTQLDGIDGLTSVCWRDCPKQWQAPFRPAVSGTYARWPLLGDLMPWQHSGVQLKRTWPIAPLNETLEQRWEALLRSSDRTAAFRETEDRSIYRRSRKALTEGADATSIAELTKDARLPTIQRYAFRAFDRQWVFADERLISRPRPDLWRAHSDQQLYLTSLLTNPLGDGPALVACAAIPDLHHFSGRGAKDVIPLFRDAEAKEPNLLEGLLAILEGEFGRPLEVQEFAAYLYGLMANPAYTAAFDDELAASAPRVPITKDPDLFVEVASIGAKLLNLHTFGERYAPEDNPLAFSQLTGNARNTISAHNPAKGYPQNFAHDAANQVLRVGVGEFSPVSTEVFEFEVSGRKVLQSWLKYRVGNGAGRKSSPLDDICPNRWTAQMNNELIMLIWVLEATVAYQPEQARLLHAVTKGECFAATDFPPVPDHARLPPEQGLEVSDQADAFADG
ncbi:MAG: N-6 DNA methylase [Gammaproteobacteria bacterium]|nr:N-6 DNA methylase [Gammaproteobacteria bacterium]